MLSITIPIYNEAGSIGLLYDKVRTAMEKQPRTWELILVNDGSQDGSDKLLDEIAAKDSRVKVVHFRRNFGQTAAMMAGFDFSTGSVVIPMDGDLQNDPEDIPLLLAKLDEGFDVVSGWRKDRQDNAIKRNFPSIMANRLISWVSGVRLHDFGCSLKAYRREVLDGVRLYGEMHRFLPIYAKWHGAKIDEVVVRHHARAHGNSKYGLERVLKVIADLITVKFLDRFQQKPMYLFAGVGLVFLLISLFTFLLAVAFKFFITPSKAFVETPLPLITAVAGSAGVMCVLMGLLAEMIVRTFYESQGKRVYLVRATRNVEVRNGNGDHHPRPPLG
jgi:glycosyltransferase involved in cell wall biosynthesis